MFFIIGGGFCESYVGWELRGVMLLFMMCLLCLFNFFLLCELWKEILIKVYLFGFFLVFIRNKWVIVDCWDYLVNSCYIY